MTDSAISVEGLSKRYRLGANAQPYQTLRESLAGMAGAPLRRAARLAGRGAREGERGHRPEFWALKDVSFTVQRGEVLGIIGHNGAGKSTLLKLLSQITEPTEGRIAITGRVASLLEVGTGFHPELTGRENVFLNGAILGMSNAEVTGKFDEIVAFAEVEKFIDTPVKRYSSGMYLRLAFAVAAHLEPEILIVDEVLAVGDTQFQRKCLGKMGEVSQEGRTVLFVSHNMPAVLQLCQKALWIDKGQHRTSGPVSTVVAAYLASGSSDSGEQLWPGGVSNPGVHEFQLHAVRLLNDRGQVTASVTSTESIDVELEYEITEPLAYCRVGFILSTSAGTEVMEMYDVDTGDYDRVPRQPGRYTSVCTIPSHLLTQGRYVITVNAGTTGVKNFVRLHNVVAFEVEETRAEGAVVGGQRRGCIRPSVRWHVARNESMVR